MYSPPNPLYDPSRRRRGARRYRHAPGPVQQPPISRLATTAAIAYGAYRLCAWAWNAYFEDGGDGNNAKQEEDGDDILCEGTADHLRVEREKLESGETDYGSNGEPSNPPPPRSRRSRDDWGSNQKRSTVPSPPQDFCHVRHDNDGHVEGGGMVKQGMKKEAAAASTGIGAAVGAGITAGIQAYNGISNQQSTFNSIPDQERRVRMGRCRLETSRAMVDFLPTLKKAVMKETSVVAETEELKKLRIEKRYILELRENVDIGDATSKQNLGSKEEMIREKERRLWNDVKNKSITRLFTTVYAHTIIYLVLTVQVNLLGGRLLREEREETESVTEQQQQLNALGNDRYRTSHQKVLAETYHYLFAKGIPSLVESVEQAVTTILQDFDVLGDTVSLRDVSMWVERLRDKIELRKEERNNGLSPLLKFVIPPEGGETEGSKTSTDSTTDDLAKYILDETYDLLESPQFAITERQCLDTTYDQLQTKVVGKLFLLKDDVPLANVVTHLQKKAVSTFHKPPSPTDKMTSWNGLLGITEELLPAVPNDYISKLERLDDVIELADVCF